MKRKWKILIAAAAVLAVLVLLLPRPIWIDKTIYGYAVTENGEHYSDVEFSFSCLNLNYLIFEDTLRVDIEFPEGGFRPLEYISAGGELIKAYNNYNIKYYNAVDTETGAVVDGYIAVVLDSLGRSVFVLIACPDNGQFKYIVGSDDGQNSSPQDLCQHFLPFLPKLAQN